MSKEIYQLKITARYITPIISRTILVPSDITFLDLHYIIVELFGFDGEHLFAFNITSDYRTQISNGTEGTKDASKIKLFENFKTLKSIDYTYDFGDNWEFIVTLQNAVKPDSEAQYPQCIKWEAGMLLEDCGGEEIYQIIANWCRTKTEENEQKLVDVYNGDETILEEYANFNPDKFDPNKINFRKTF